jgi:hypothetical protein
VLRDAEKPGSLSPLNYGIRRILRKQRFDAVWIHGYGSLTNLQFIVAANSGAASQSQTWLVVPGPAGRLLSNASFSHGCGNGSPRRCPSAKRILPTDCITSDPNFRFSPAPMQWITISFSGNLQTLQQAATSFAGC